MTIVELERCVALLLEMARRRGIDEVVPPNVDGYWTVTSPAWTQVYQTPQPAVGSFSDDEQELQKVLRDPSRGSAVDLERAAHLLRLLSDQLAT